MISRRKKILDAHCADDLLFLANTPKQAEYQVHNEEKSPRDINLYVTSDKTEFMHFKQNGTISTLNDNALMLQDHFIYISSNISSTESDVGIRIGKVWTVINRLLTIRKSNLSDEIKQEFFQAVVVAVSTCQKLF